MLSLGALAFAQPWLLAALAGLPAIYFLLRLIPPPPRDIDFPPVRLIAQLVRRENVAQRTPWWLLLLRMLALALVIVALARPVLNPSAAFDGQGPLLIVIDDGWPAAPRWQAIRDAAVEAVGQAEREGRTVALLTTATSVDARGVELLSASDARDRLVAAEPKAWWPNRPLAIEALQAANLQTASVLWLTDGVARDEAARAYARSFAAVLDDLGPLTVVAPPSEARPPVLIGLDGNDSPLQLVARTTEAAVDRSIVVRALGDNGAVLARLERPVPLDGGAVDFDIALPPEQIERVRSVETEPSSGAGGVVLYSSSVRLQRVGLISAGLADDQPLLAERFFVERALSDRADVQTGSLESLLESGVGALVLVDGEPLTDAQGQQLRDWVEAGGVLLRFAGPRLAEAPGDALVPVPLRAGDRLLDGALSWSEPLALGGFKLDGPLNGLPMSPDVRINRQVLAQPSPDLAAATLATLTDGTPLVTGRASGAGWLLLVHTTANTQWSNFALSGTFVALLERVAQMGSGAAQATAGPLVPTAVLDAYGRLRDPGADIAPIDSDALQAADLGPGAPPGLYLATDGSGGLARNVGRLSDEPSALSASDVGTAVRTLERSDEVFLAPWLLLLALIALLADLAVTMAARGAVPQLRPVAAASLLAAMVLATPTWAQEIDPGQASLATALAYVRSGDAEVNRIALAGLEGLAMVLARRTSVEPGDPVAIDIAEDPLDLYPLLFWPVPGSVQPLDELSAERLLAYLDGGGMVVFDTRDANLAVPGAGFASPGVERLRVLLAGTELPPMERVGGDHALTRSFYLLQDFPGRFAGQAVWVDVAQPGVNDGVSAVVIGGNDWLGAWAVDEFQRPLLPVAPGGERQREMARRFGVNLVMYALTGNYKTDQVHIPTLLERLGQ